MTDFVSKMEDLANYTDPEDDVYFYHADHLGSASWITDASGIPVQHLQYLPFGESFVDQHTSGYEERYTFTGKEKDSETGYYAFGARYYDCDLSGIFLSVDPMSDKYPSLSPYAYCAWNPVKLVDPDGMTANPVYDTEGNYLGDTKEGFTGAPIIVNDIRLNQCIKTENDILQNLTAETVSIYGKYFDDVASALSSSAQEKIFTHIVSNLEGTEVGEYVFSMSEIGGKINYYYGDEKVEANFASSSKQSKIFARHTYDLYETTVENLQCSVLNHEWYGHIKMGWGNGNQKATKSEGGTHYKCYQFVINSPLFKKTTEKYQEFYKTTYDHFSR